MFSSHHFRTFSKNWSVFFETLPIKFTKLHSTRPKDHFEDITLFWQSFYLFFQWFLEIKRRNNGFFLSKNNRKLCQSCLPRIQGDILQRIFSEKVLFFHHWALSDFFLSFLRKFVGPVVSTVFCLSNGPVCGEKTFVQKFFSHLFRRFSKNLSSFFRNFFGQLDKDAFYESGGSIWGHIFVLTKFFSVFFSCSSELEQRIIGFFFVEKQSEDLSQLLTTCPGGYFAEIFFDKVFLLFHHWALSDFFLSFLRKFVGPVVSTVFCLSNGPVCGEKTFVQKFFSHLFWTLIAKLMVVNQNFFSQVDETASYKSEGSIWRQRSALKNFCIFFHPSRTLNEQLTVFSVGTWIAVLSKLLTICQKDLLKKLFFEYVLFCSSMTLERNFPLAFRQKLLCGVVKIAFGLCIATLCGKSFFCQKCFSPIIFGQSAKICLFFFRNFFGQLDKTAFYKSKGKIWGQNFVLTKILLAFFHVLPKLNGDKMVFFVGKQSANLTHLLTTYPRRFFEEFFFWKSSFFDHWAMSDFCMSFRRKFVGPLSVLLSGCQFGQFVVKKILQIFFLHHFRTWIANWSVFIGVFFRQVDETAFYKSEGSIWRQTSALKLFCMFFHPSRTFNEQLTVFSVGKQTAVLSKLITTCQGDLLNRFFFE